MIRWNSNTRAFRIGPRTRMQCRVCGYIYDPDQGCRLWQAKPGTPFGAVPDHLDCPACGCPHSGFLVLDREEKEPRHD